MNPLVAVSAKIHQHSLASLLELARQQDRSVSWMVRRAVSQFLREAGETAMSK